MVSKKFMKDEIDRLKGLEKKSSYAPYKKEYKKIRLKWEKRLK